METTIAGLIRDDRTLAEIKKSIAEMQEKRDAQKLLFHQHAGYLSGKCYLRNDIPQDIVDAIAHLRELAFADINSLTIEQLKEKYEPRATKG